MKNLFLSIALVLCCTSLFGQKLPTSNSYGELKDIYDASSYVRSDSDPYPAFWCAAGSFFFPGLGQFITNEPRRGVKFLAGSFALGLLTEISGMTFVTIALAEETAEEYPDDNIEFTGAGRAAVLVSGAAMMLSAAANLGLSIWSAVDAAQIAKVKNMCWQESARAQSMNATVYPSVKVVRTGSGLKPAAGMTLAINF